MIVLNDKALESVTGGMTGDTIKDWNGIKYVEYVVKSGDCLSVIAMNHGTTLEAVKNLNPEIRNVDLIEVGQVIRIPYTV